MKNLIEYIEEKLIVNKDYNTENNYVDFEDRNINELYLVRLYPIEKSIYFDVVNDLRIKLGVNKPDANIYDLSGDFITGNDGYSNAAFTYEQPGILIRPMTYHVQWYDILLPPKYIDNFKELIEEYMSDYTMTCYLEEVFDTLGIMGYVDWNNIPSKLKGKEYVLENYKVDVEKIQDYLKHI